MFEEQTYESVLKRMKDGVEVGIDTREGSVMHNALAPAALEIAYCYDLLKMILRETYIDTASREYLILRASERGITPNPATYAEIKARITGTNLDVNEVLGATFACDSVFYEVTEIIDANENLFKLKCKTAGTVGNIPTGYLSNEDYLANLETAEIVSVITFAEDEEDTEVFRARYMNSLQSTPFAGNISAYKELMSSFENVGGAKVVPAWVSDDRNGKVEVIVVPDNLDAFTDEEIESLQQSVCPGTYFYSVLGSWAVGDTITVNGDTYTAIESGTSDDFTFLTTWSSSAIANKIAKSFYNSKRTSAIIQCKTNYAITVNSSASGSVVKAKDDLTGGTGVGLAPIGHDVKITPAKGKLVIVNFDPDGGEDYGYQTSGTIADIRNALINVTQSFTDKWEEYENEMPLYLSWYISALQQLKGFVAVAGLRFYVHGKSPEGDVITLGRDEYPYFIPTNDDLRDIFAHLDGADINSIADSNGTRLKIKVLRDDGGVGYYTLYPYLEGKSRLEAYASIGGYTFNWTQCRYFSFTNLPSLKSFIATVDKEHFCSTNRTGGTGELSLGLGGRCKNIFEYSDTYGGYLDAETKNEIPFTISGADNKYSDSLTVSNTTLNTLSGNINLRFYLGTNARINSGVANRYAEYNAIWEAISPVIEEYDKELREQWLNEDDPDTPTVFDLNELGRRCKAATVDCDFTGSKYLGFDPVMFEDQVITEEEDDGTLKIVGVLPPAVSVDLEAKTATLPVYMPPVISMTLHHETTEDMNSEVYARSYIWRN